MRLCGDGQDLPRRPRRAQAGARSGRERRVRRAHGQGGFRAHPRGRSRGDGPQPHLYARRGHRSGRERRGHLRALPALCQKGEDRRQDPSHRAGRDEHGLGRRAARSFVLRRQVPLLRRPRAAPARRRLQHPARDARHHAEGDRAAGGERHRAACGARARGRRAALRDVRLRRGDPAQGMYRRGARKALFRSRSDHRRDQPHPRRRQPRGAAHARHRGG